MLARALGWLRPLILHDIFRLALLLAFAAFLVDWATKSWALDTLHDTARPFGSLVLSLERNEAFAFSAGNGRVPSIVVVGLRLLALAGVVVVFRNALTRSRRYAIGSSLLLAGGFGNAADVLFRGGAVVDFIGAGPFHFEWNGDLVHATFVFNAADVWILVGLGLVAPQIQAWALAGQRRLAAWEGSWRWRRDGANP